MSAIDTGLSAKIKATDLVTAYLEAMEITRQAYADLDRAKKILDAAFGDGSYSMDVLPDKYVYGGIEKAFEKVNDHATRNAWRHIINLVGVRQIMGRKQIDAMDTNLEHGKVEPLTMENVRQLVDGLAQNSPEFAYEAVKEVFDFLRPGAADYDHYKTNAKNARYELGTKVVIQRAVEVGFGGYKNQNYKVSHWRNQELTSVDRIFHLADGKSMSAANCYNSPLIDAIQTTPTYDGKGQTAYFKFTCYQNGNLHLTFLRPDLVTKLNRAAGGENRLRGN